jgi:hypothetical protein
MFAEAYVAETMGDPDSCHGAPPTSTCAAFIKESRMELINAIKINRKYGRSPTIAFIKSAACALLMYLEDHANSLDNPRRRAPASARHHQK